LFSQVTLRLRDLFVTLANIGGGKVPHDRELDGLYIQTIFDGGALAERSLFWAFNSKSDLEFAVRLGSWKLFLGREKPA
jgi:hypothetical protein